MKKILFIASTLAIIAFNSCKDSLDLAPISSISDGNYWKTPEQYDAFVAGLHARFRSRAGTFQTLGEMRADIFGTDPGSSSTFTGEATQGVERLWTNNLDLDNPGVSNYGGFYTNIAQINLLIDKLSKTEVVSAANRSYYLGIAYGMRAYYYFQMTRAWGKVIIQTDPTYSIDVSNLAKPASDEAAVMQLIKADIEQSISNFGSDYSMKNTKSFWSKPATLMLKAEVFLWTSYRGGGNADATTAKTALTEIQTNVPSLALLPSFASVFSATTKGHNEMIFACRNLLNESSLSVGNFIPQTGLIANFFDSLNNRKFDVVTDNWGGLLRAPTQIATFRRFNDKDLRRNVSIQAAYNKPATGYVIAGCFLNKFQGEQNAGARAFSNDYPIYRYADLLLLLAEAKIILGENPATEINLVRARAFGTNYVAATHAFPNQVGDSDAKKALLNERFFEFIFEGKRWLDLRRLGDAYVYANTNITAAQAFKLLWPVDRTTLTNNKALTQTPGYPAF